MSDIFEAIADPTRRALLDALLDAQLVGGKGELTVTELVETTKLGQPAVSKHLKMLSDVGLVAARAEGQKRFYTVTPEPLEQIEDWIINFLSLDFDPDADGEDFAQTLGAAGEKLGHWLTSKAKELQAEVENRVGKVDIDPKKIGRTVGRRIADAKSDATKEGQKLQREAKKTAKKVVAEIKSETKALAKTAKTKLPGKKK